MGLYLFSAVFDVWRRCEGEYAMQVTLGNANSPEVREGDRE